MAGAWATIGSDETRRRGHHARIGGNSSAGSGSLPELRAAIGVAKSDYRDVLATAEYPEHSKLAFHSGKAGPEHDAAISADWEQYKQWFER